MGPVFLLILDGWGYSPEKKGNAIALARTPNFKGLWKDYPHCILGASEKWIGLPKGQIGGSEVGHLAIGAGTIALQGLVQLSVSIEDGSFYSNKVLLDAISGCKRNNSTLHLMGLVSDGGIHSMDTHLYALLNLAKREGLKNVVVHAFLDGRDTPPTSGVEHVRKLMSKMKEIGVGALGSVVGRFYIMDRDKRWDRVQTGYDLIVLGKGDVTDDPLGKINEYYAKNITDEFMKPIMVKGTPRINDNDSVIMFNFRADRAREITWALCNREFKDFVREGWPQVHYVCMAPYDKSMNLPVAFYPVPIKNSLGEVLSQRGLKQLRIAETEKYAHVTFFFSGGREEVFPGEERILIPSPKEVSTYDKKPEMSAKTVTDSVVGEIQKNKFDFILMNLANPDMVGHTGDLKATIQAVEVVDECLGRIVDEVKKAGGKLIVTADHGNADYMIDSKGNPVTAHSLAHVPCIFIAEDSKGYTLHDGTLLDLAPTILQLLGIPKPNEMTGKCLIDQLYKNKQGL